MDKKFLFADENAVNVVIGNIFNLMILTLIVGSFIAAFYLKAEDSSRQTMRIGYVDLGNQIARDITNSYIISENSLNITINIKRDIPLTIGGKGYIILLNNATSKKMANIGIIDTDFSEYPINITLNSIDSNSINNIKTNGIVYSGSGHINIKFVKNYSGEYVQIQ